MGRSAPHSPARAVPLVPFSLSLPWPAPGLWPSRGSRSGPSPFPPLLSLTTLPRSSVDLVSLACGPRMSASPFPHLSPGDSWGRRERWRQLSLSLNRSVTLLPSPLFLPLSTRHGQKAGSSGIPLAPLTKPRLTTTSPENENTLRCPAHRSASRLRACA